MKIKPITQLRGSIKKCSNFERTKKSVSIMTTIYLEPRQSLQISPKIEA
jgi:hypothetical protein